MEKKSMEKTDFINKIKDRPLTGYLWLSNESIPSLKRIYDNAAIDTSVFDCEKSFVAEGLLYDDNAKLSYQIKFINGSYQIFENESEPKQGEEVSSKSYIAHRINGVKKLKFNQIYAPKEDKECCRNMQVLTLDRVVFVGFEK